MPDAFKRLGLSGLGRSHFRGSLLMFWFLHWFYVHLQGLQTLVAALVAFCAACIAYFVARTNAASAREVADNKAQSDQLIAAGRIDFERQNEEIMRRRKVRITRNRLYVSNNMVLQRACETKEIADKVRESEYMVRDFPPTGLNGSSFEIYKLPEFILTTVDSELLSVLSQNEQIAASQLEYELASYSHFIDEKIAVLFQYQQNLFRQTLSIISCRQDHIIRCATILINLVKSFMSEEDDVDIIPT